MNSLIKNDVEELISTAEDPNPRSHLLANSLPSTFTRPRRFNHISIYQTSSGNLVLKSSSDSSLNAEFFFYQNIPSSLKSYFPQLFGHFVTRKSSKSILTIALEYIPAVPISQKLTNGTLTNAHLRDVLNVLHKLHTTQTDAPPLSHVVLTCNYIPKIRLRFNSNQVLYRQLGVTTDHIDTLCVYLQQHKVLVADVIHGDPVFTNILHRTDTGATILLDMRGAQGKIHSTAGDVYYDLSKVLQSLCGYDHILTGTLFSRSQQAQLLHIYFEEVSKLYPAVSGWHLVMVTCSLFFSLIPLHDNDRAQKKFSSLAICLLRWLRFHPIIPNSDISLDSLLDETQSVVRHSSHNSVMHNPSF